MEIWIRVADRWDWNWKKGWAELSWVELRPVGDRLKERQVDKSKVGGAGRGAVVSHVWAWHANENAFIYKANDKSPKCQSKRCEETKSVSVSRSNRMYLYLSICKCIFIRIATWQAWSKMQNCTCCLLSNYLLAVHTHGYSSSCHMPHVTRHTIGMGNGKEVSTYRKKISHRISEDFRIKTGRKSIL